VNREAQPSDQPAPGFQGGIGICLRKITALVGRAP